MNIDWFNPRKKTKDTSVGAIHMALLNLLRYLRFLKGNVILVGNVPNLPHEQANINSFLQPLVEELKALWKGVNMTTDKHPNGVVVIAALLAAASDVPASRELCGFLGQTWFLVLNMFEGISRWLWR